MEGIECVLLVAMQNNEKKEQNGLSIQISPSPTANLSGKISCPGIEVRMGRRQAVKKASSRGKTQPEGRRLPTELAIFRFLLQMGALC